MNDPITPSEESAAQVHEVYSVYVKAGFSPDQAMQIVLKLLELILKANPPPPT